MRTVPVTRLQHLPPQDIGRGRVQVAIDARGRPFCWFAERVDLGYYLAGQYRFLRFAKERVVRLAIPPVSGSYPQLYPFTDGRLLVVFASTRRYTERGNAAVYSRSGELMARFRTADAVEDVQITSAGHIWVSYFDETDDGQLDCFDQDGQLLFRYQRLCEEHDLPSIFDCYALNVSTDTETWVYYYDAFPLVRLVDRQLAGRWDASAIPGSHAFAVDGRRALFAGSYRHRDSLFLFDLASGAVEELQPVYDTGVRVVLSTYRCIGRGSRLYLHGNGLLFVLDLTDIP